MTGPWDFPKILGELDSFLIRRHYQFRFLCLKQLNLDEAACTDFEARFCCPSSTSEISTVTESVSSQKSTSFSRKRSISRRQAERSTSQPTTLFKSTETAGGSDVSNLWSFANWPFKSKPSTQEDLRNLINSVNSFIC